MIESIYSPDVHRYENGMRYRRCGKSGVMLPEISLGLWHNFGTNDDYEKNIIYNIYYISDRILRLAQHYPGECH